MSFLRRSYVNIINLSHIIQVQIQTMDEQIPKEWFCPITQEIMKNPVIASDGFSYEKQALQNWFKKSNISPLTGIHLHDQNMIPNHALRQTIQHHFQKKKQKPGNLGHRKSQKESDKTITVANLSYSIDRVVDEKDNGKLYVSLNIVPPQKPIGKRMPCSIICIVDISESMDTDSVLGVKNAESHGFSRLDLVKHSLNTMVQFMGTQDELTLITFNNSAKLILPPTKTDNKGKIFIKNTIRNLSASGTTNIWDGLKISLEVIKQKLSYTRKNTFVALLTDGEPNLNPPRGIIPTFKKFIQISELRAPNIHVFGYGYELDSKLLTEIAEIGHGSYTYIPDCSMVGTAFINFMSTALSTVTNLMTLKLNPKNDSGFKRVLGFKKQPDSTYNLGVIQFGQSRQIILEYDLRLAKGEIENYADFTLSYGMGLQNKLIENIPVGQFNSGQRGEQILMRIRYLKLLQKLCEHDKPNFKENFEMVTQFFEEISKAHEKYESELTQSLLKQLRNDKSEKEGQVAKSFEKEEWYLKWGKHYIPSLHLAHTMQICTNFKDPALQLYAGEQFEKNRTQLDTVFIKMAPPQPTAKKEKNIVYKPAPVDMSDYYNEWGGCVYSENRVQLENGRKIKVKNLQKGDKIKTAQNQIVTVQCLVQTNIFAFVKMIQIGELLITPFHPIYFQSQWKFPQDIKNQLGVQEVQKFVESYYNVILAEGGQSFLCQGIECISLAHSIQDEVAKHEYLGTNKVRKHLQTSNEYKNGKVRVSSALRDPVSRKITQFVIMY